MTPEEKTAAGYLPDRLADAVYRTVHTGKMPIAEIRLRRDGPLSLTMGTEQKNYLCGVICTADELTETAQRLCGGSLYAHAETIREGVIVTAEGLRAGIAGRAVIRAGRMESVHELSSVSIRIPHRVKGAGDALGAVVRQYGSTLLASPPGMGKTTALRELIPLLAGGENALRLAVIDTRYELGAGMERSLLADFYSGWLRAEGMAAAIRTMTPECILCDEIADAADCAAIRTAAASGVMVVASAHASSMDTLCRNAEIRKLLEDGIFGCVCGMSFGKLTVWQCRGEGS
ncbi:MAG: hypothetical protein IJC71_08205 [Clostridia bacterium]|nr:hypothetical protein [Clostridia bacterium]